MQIRFKQPVSFYPGYQRFFSRAVGIFGVGRRPTQLRPTAEATSGEETALEKSLAPRIVSFILRKFLFIIKM